MDKNSESDRDLDRNGQGAHDAHGSGDAEARLVPELDADLPAPNTRCLWFPHATQPPMPPVQIPALAGTCRSAASVSFALAVCAAAIGRAFVVENLDGRSLPLVLRSGLVRDKRSRPAAWEAVLDAALRAQAIEAERKKPQTLAVELLRAVDKARARLVRSTMAQMSLLGLSAGGDPAHLLETRQLETRGTTWVLNSTRPTAIGQALAASRGGLLVLSDRWMPSQRVGPNIAHTELFDLSAADRLIEVGGRSPVLCHRCICAGGVLTPADATFLHRCSPAEIRLTMFCADDPNTARDEAAIVELAELLVRLRTLRTGDGAPVLLALPAEGKRAVAAATTAWRHGSDADTPLDTFMRGLPDLVAVIAAVVHVVEAAGENRPVDRRIGAVAVEQALGFAQNALVPAAQGILCAASVAPEHRNARRLLSFAQTHCSVATPLVRRDLRTLWRTMAAAEVDAALDLLVSDGLLMPVMRASSGKSYHVHPVVFSAEMRLPDLIGDPRRAA